MNEYDPEGYVSGDELFDSIRNTAPMAQLIILGMKYEWGAPDDYFWGYDMALPYTSKDNYSCYTEEVSTKAEMLSGRIVKDIRGRATIIKYKYDYMPPKIMYNLLFLLRSKLPFYVYYRPDDDPDNLYLNEFVCESVSVPKYAFASSRYERDVWQYDKTFMEPKWHGIEFTLRQVEPDCNAIWFRQEK